mgnify:FL=1
MPFKPFSNALLSPYKVPFGVYLYNYLITKNLRRLLNNSFFHPYPRLLCIFCQYILMSDRYWVLDVEWWVLMISIKFIVNPHIIITQHSIPHIINTQHSLPITQHPTPITQHSIPHIINTQHSSPNTHPPTFNPTHHHHPTSNTYHPTFNPINFIISFFLCKFAVK